MNFFPIAIDINFFHKVFAGDITSLHLKHIEDRLIGIACAKQEAWYQFSKSSVKIIVHYMNVRILIL